MNRVISIISILILVVIILGCDSSGNTIHIDQETKDYCLFEQGSYWVYQDSASLETDSIVIKTSPYFTSSTAGGSTDNKEVYSFNVEIFLNDTVELYYSRIRPGMDAEFDSQKPIWFFLENAPSPSINDYTYNTYHNGTIGSCYNTNIYTNNDFYSKYDSFHDNYMFNGIGYQNVKVFILLEDTLPTSMIKKLYWAKYIGLIRIEDYSYTTEVSVKNLIRYNVENFQ